MFKIVVLISGNGSNLQAILDACSAKQLAAEVVAVISNKADVKGLERAKKFSIPAIAKIKSQSQSRPEYDQELAEIVQSYQPDLIVLAGWMHVLSNQFLKHFPNKIINLHPALSGEFPGTKSIERAFQAFQKGEIKQTGVMVHFVPDEGVDSGPVLDQMVVPIQDTDSLETLSARMHEAEHELLLKVLNQFCNSCLRTGIISSTEPKRQSGPIKSV